MRDSFLASHHEICLIPGSQRFNPDLLDRIARFFETNSFIIPDTQELNLTRHVQTHEAFFRRLLESNNVGFMISLPEIEKLLFQAVSLHRYLFSIRHPNMTENERRSQNVLMVMCKQKLIELFLDLDPIDVPTVFEIETLSNILGHVWNSSCELAHTCARAVRLFSELDECWMFMPSVYEMYMLGTDILIFSEDEQWCVQIKQPHTDDTKFLIEHVQQEPQGSALPKIEQWKKRLFCGANHLENHFPEYEFLPCHVTMPTEHHNDPKKDIETARLFFLDADSHEVKQEFVAA